MYKILIADDEGIVTDSLQFIIRKHFGEECQTSIAKNGRQAIEQAEHFRPDIIFLDIQMPGINGLKAMEEIRAQNPKVKILILTAYDNFDYAKEALRLGAVNYLTKPINKNVIVEQLTNIMHTVDQERQKRMDDLIVKEKMEAVVPIIENGFLVSLIIQNEYEGSGKQYRTLLNLEEDYGFILVIEWGEGREKNGMGNPVGSGVRAHKYYDKMAELVKVYFKAYVSSIMGNKVVCAVPAAERELEYGERLRTIEKTRHLCDALKTVAGTDFKVGIGSTKTWEAMFESYQEALNALRHGKRRVTHIEDLIVKSPEVKQQQEMENVVLEAVRRGMEYDVRQEATVFAGWLLKNKDMELQEVKTRMMELLLLTKRLVREQEGELAEETKQETLKQILEEEDREVLRRQFVSAMVKMAKAIVIHGQEPDGIVARAKEYIRQNFRHDLALEEVARAVDISPYYFSKLFKEEAGTNFSEYLTDLRIEEAKHLLKAGELSIKQVCAESGYSNPNYFSRIFKKWTGITPTEFRDALQEDS